MTPEIETAFKEADLTSRLLGDFKHGVHEVKSAGGISEKDKLIALWGFCDQADDIIKNLRLKIGEAMGVLDEKLRAMD